MMGWMALNLLRRRYARDHVVPPARVQSVQKLRLSSEGRVVGKVVNDN